MNVSDFKRYEKKSIPQLIKIATKHFNKFIRDRDSDKPCISCGGRPEEAGHFYSGGHYSALRFLENNVHGQCKRCNRHLHGNLIEYEKRLKVRIGEDEVQKLHDIADYYKKNPYKWDRFALYDIILKYK